MNLFTLDIRASFCLNHKHIGATYIGSYIFYTCCSFISSPKIGAGFAFQYGVESLRGYFSDGIGAFTALDGLRLAEF